MSMIRITIVSTANRIELQEKKKGSKTEGGGAYREISAPLWKPVIHSNAVKPGNTQRVEGRSDGGG